MLAFFSSILVRQKQLALFEHFIGIFPENWDFFPQKIEKKMEKMEFSLLT